MYDRVEWEFLEAVMRKIGFCDAWVVKVMNWIRLISFSFILNGEVNGNIFLQED